MATTATAIPVQPVIMAGGSGTRLWPLSRAGYPKQFLVLHGNASLLQQAAQRLAALREAPCAATGLDGEASGPADAPLALVRGRRRKRLLVRADRDVDLQGFLRAWLARVKVPGSVRLTVDVDPYSFL